NRRAQSLAARRVGARKEWEMPQSAKSSELASSRRNVIDIGSRRQRADRLNDVGATSAVVAQEEGSCLQPHHTANSNATCLPDTFGKIPDTVGKIEDTPDMLQAALAHLAKGRSVWPVCSPHRSGRGCNEHPNASQCDKPGKRPLVT